MCNKFSDSNLNYISISTNSQKLKSWSIIGFLNQLLLPYKLYGRSMREILFFNFASCESLTYYWFDASKLFNCTSLSTKVPNFQRSFAVYHWWQFTFTANEHRTNLGCDNLLPGAMVILFMKYKQTECQNTLHYMRLFV